MSKVLLKRLLLLRRPLWRRLLPTGLLLLRRLSWLPRRRLLLRRLVLRKLLLRRLLLGRLMLNVPGRLRDGDGGEDQAEPVWAGGQHPRDRHRLHRGVLPDVPQVCVLHPQVVPGLH